MKKFAGQTVGILVLIAACAGLVRAQNRLATAPIHVKVVVVSMFERGEDTGDAPGEYQLWWSGSTWTRFFRSRPATTTCG